MFLHLLAMAGGEASNTGGGGGTGSPTTIPKLGDAVVYSLSQGACKTDGSFTVDTPASVRVEWTVTNPDDTNYEIRIYDAEGVRLDRGIPTSSTTWDKTVTGMVEGGRRGTPITWQFRVDIVKTDGTPVASSTTNTLLLYYGDCSE